MLKVFNERKINEDTYLRLIEEGGTVRLVACSVSGYSIMGGSLLSIDESGIELLAGVRPDLGISLDEEGCVRLDSE